MRLFAPFNMPDKFYFSGTDYYPGTDNIQHCWQSEITWKDGIYNARIEKIRQWIREEKAYFYKDEKLAAKNARIGEHNCIIELEIDFKKPAIFNKKGAIIANDKCDFRYCSKSPIPELFDVDIARAQRANKGQKLFVNKDWMLPLVSLAIFAAGLLLIQFSAPAVAVVSPLMEMAKMLSLIIGGVVATMASFVFLISSHNVIPEILHGAVNIWITKDHSKKYQASLGLEQKNTTELISRLRSSKIDNKEALIKKLTDIQSRAKDAVFYPYGGLDENQPVRNKLQVTRWVNKRLTDVLATYGVEQGQLLRDTLHNADTKLELLSKKRKI